MDISEFSERQKQDYANVLQRSKVILEDMQYTITNNQRRTFELLSVEKAFIETLLEKAMHMNIPNKFNFKRLSDGTINVCYGLAQIGRIKLCGKKSKMQTLNEIDVNWFENLTLDEYLSMQKCWLDYLNGRLLNKR